MMILLLLLLIAFRSATCGFVVGGLDRNEFSGFAFSRSANFGFKGPPLALERRKQQQQLRRRQEQQFGECRKSSLLAPRRSSLGGGEWVERDGVEYIDMFEKEDRLKTSLGSDDVLSRLESCILVGVEDLSYHRISSAERERLDVYNQFSLEESMVEMRELVSTAGMTVEREVSQRLNEPNPKTYIGTGKTKEIAEICKETGVCTVVFDAELSPRQLKHLENAFGEHSGFKFRDEDESIKVIDRTALILDIFAQHAKTKEGQLQVELALHTYRAPRLTKMWSHLERQSGAGGVGLRGPGERQLEIDKRLLRDKINSLKKQIDEVQKQRSLHRKGRKNLGIPIVALVGYTNAGKSTMLNFLTKAGVMAEDILFATLDPTTRRVKLPGLKTHPEVRNDSFFFSFSFSF